MLNKKTRFSCFRKFLQYKISNKDVRQIDIAKFIGKDAPYINKLYKGRLKACPDELQEKIAEFFGLSIEELLQSGKKLLKQEQTVNECSQNKSSNNHSFFNATTMPSVCSYENQWVGLKRHAGRFSNDLELINSFEVINRKIRELEEEENYYNNFIKLLDLIHKKLKEKIICFDENHELCFTNIELPPMDNIDKSKKITIHSILLHYYNLIENFEEVRVNIWAVCYKHEKERSVNVRLKTGKEFFIKVTPIFIDDEFGGTFFHGYV